MRSIIILSFMLISGSFAHAQNDTLMPKDTAGHGVMNEIVPTTPDSKSDNVRNKYNPAQFGQELLPFVKAPLRWRAKEWLIFAGVIGTSYAIMYADQSVRDFAHRNSQYSDNIVMDIGNEWGGFYFIPATSLVLYSHGLIAKNAQTKKLGFEIAQAALYSETIQFIFKNLVGRSRPFREEGPWDFHPPSFFHSPRNSFPAGHVNAAMALSVVLARNTHHTGLKILAFVPTAVTATARIMHDEHWASDVFIGGVIGFTVGNWVINLHEKKETGLQVSSVYPLSLKYVFK